MSSDTSTVAYVFMRNYSDRQIADAATRKHPFSDKASKAGNLSGEDFRYFLKHSNPGSVGGTFATTQASPGNSKGVQFATTPALKYGVITIHGPSMARAAGKGAKVELVMNETDGVLEEMADHLAFDLLRTGTGVRGRRASISGNIVTLTNAADVRNFKVGMPVGASSLATGLSPRAGANTTVAGISRSAGTVTLADASQITSFSDNDYMFVPGDPGTCVEGIQAIIPFTAPAAAESFRGVDRSVDEQRLAGARLDLTSAPIEENIGSLATTIFDDGKVADSAFISPLNFWKVSRRLGAKVEYEAGRTADYGFQFINIITPGGVVKVYADPDMPADRGLVGSLADLEVKHLKEYVHIIRDDKQMALRQATVDGIEIRARSMSQPCIYQPGSWGIFSI
jgi:hypothetical protein